VIERNPITDDAVIVAPDRASRPNIYRHEERCPFCPGNESDTPPEIWRDRDPWRIRIFPNKYPATEHHEVIVEGGTHGGSFDQLEEDMALSVVDRYIDRYHALARKSQYVCVFKNHGVLAGASIPHPHSQVLGIPFMPPRIVKEAGAFESRCALCELRDEEIAVTANYRWIAPHGSLMAYEQWIVPKHHAPEMIQGLELAVLLQRAARAMLSIADAFNWIFINFPQEPSAHWYVQLFPRLMVHAGFELGTGSAINTVDAREAARRLRAIP
jgi:UDPglucose--hexose-1-phosphate uridylyltransferase